jgi:hypothetical protein
LANSRKEDNMIDEDSMTCNPDGIGYIIDQYAAYWPLTEKQIHYLLLAEGTPETELVDIEEQLYGVADMYECETDPDGAINCYPSLHGSFLPYASVQHRKKDYRKRMMEHLSAVPDFEIWRDQQHHVELWVNDPDITDFLRNNRSRWEIQMPIHDCGRLLNPGPLTETDARLRYMKYIEGKSTVVLYLANLDYSGRERLKQMQRVFRGVARFDRIGINAEHTEGLLPKSAMGRPRKELKDDRLFQKESSLPECYSLHAVDPVELLYIVETAVKRYYDMEKYPHERVARWQKAQEHLQKSLEAVFDELLELADRDIVIDHA